jgi:HlyD family secretion protein
MSPRGRLLVVLAILAVTGGGWWLWTRNHVSTGPIALQGNVEVRQVNLAFKVAGRIKEVVADEGDTVAAGQTLASLDKVYFEDALAQARAQRDQSAANLAKMEAGNRPVEIAQAAALVASRSATSARRRCSTPRSPSTAPRRCSRPPPARRRITTMPSPHTARPRPSSMHRARRSGS